ncbi:MAG TPA: hypothetical protein VNA14_06515 [Mycobacteriales bacterium]|nr:hypothetical protein [Mycobacteriales bacterium]
MDIEGPGAGRRILLVLLAFAHLMWAVCIAMAAYFMHQLEVQGFDTPEPPNWGRTILLLAVAVYSVSAAAKILRAERTLTPQTRRYVVVASVLQPIIGIAALSL